QAQAPLVRAAQAELDRGEIEAGVAHYKAALALGPPGKGREALAETLRTQAMAALVAKKDAPLAVRWAREGVGLTDDDASHALLADMLYAAHEYESSVAEYQSALAGRPDDDTLKRGLDRARKKLLAEKSPGPRGRGKARAAKAVAADPASQSAGDGAGDTEKTVTPSAAAEPAADEQK